jgi:hypothetical protein
MKHCTIICKMCYKILYCKLSKKTGICFNCREELIPNHIPKEQFKKYWSNKKWMI